MENSISTKNKSTSIKSLASTPMKYSATNDFALLETTVYVGHYDENCIWKPLSICENDIKIYKLLNGSFRGEEIQSLTNEARQYEHGTDEYNQVKEHLPGWTWNGTVNFDDEDNRMHRSFDNIRLSGVVCIEFDDIGNYDVNDLTDKIIKSMDHCIYVGRTLSNKIFAIHRANKQMNKFNFIKYFKELFVQYYLKFGIKADIQCKDVARMRFICAQNGGKINHQYNDFGPRYNIDRTYDQVTGKHKMLNNKTSSFTTQSHINKWNPRTMQYDSFDYDIDKQKSKIHDKIVNLLDNGYSIDDMKTDNKYANWYYVACDLKNFDDGKELFIKFSNNSSEYNDSEDKIIEKYNAAKTTPLNDCIIKWCGIFKKYFIKK